MSSPRNYTGRIRYYTASSGLGEVLLAQSTRGICALFLGEDHPGLLAELEREFPGVALRKDSGLASILDALMAPLAAPESSVADPLPVADTLRLIHSPDNGPGNGSGDVLKESPAMPLDMQGTPFQLQVWQALREIPAGQTRSYVALATHIGRDRKSAQAVGQACAKNRLALLVPCHRVVPADGRVGRWRWRAERKAALLAGEGARFRESASR